MAIPQCIAITPDGNRRWAKEKGLPGVAGHSAGLLNARDVVKAAFEHGVPHVVFWGASLSNLQKRSDEEKTNIFALLKEELIRHRDEELGVSFIIRGKWQEYTNDEELKKLAAEVEEKTAVHKEHVLTVLFGYDGAPEGDAALQSLVASGDTPTWENLCKHAWTGHLPAVDLYIRTGSAHKYLSGSFMPFKLKNTLLQFPEKYWPAYDVADLEAALKEYRAFDAERRDGK